jgi:hypothetical protein
MNRSKLKLLIYSISLILIVLLIATGCGQHGIKVTGNETKAFDNASDEIKQTWENALAAEKANDYVNAEKLLDSLNQMVLDEQQRLALNDQRAAFGEHLMQAAEKNDPSAIQAVQALKNRKSR